MINDIDINNEIKDKFIIKVMDETIENKITWKKSKTLFSREYNKYFTILKDNTRIDIIYTKSIFWNKDKVRISLRVLDTNRDVIFKELKFLNKNEPSSIDYLYLLITNQINHYSYSENLKEINNLLEEEINKKE